MDIPELAQKIVKQYAGIDHEKRGYYLLNINHPVILALKERYCSMRKIHSNVTMSDQERIEFELWVIQPSARKMIENIMEGV